MHPFKAGPRLPKPNTRISIPNPVPKSAPIFKPQKNPTPPIPSTPSAPVVRTEAPAPTYTPQAPSYEHQYVPAFEQPFYDYNQQYQVYQQPYYYPQQIISDAYGQPYAVYPVAYYQPQPMMSYNFQNYVAQKKNSGQQITSTSPPQTRLVPPSVFENQGIARGTQIRQYATPMQRRSPGLEDEDSLAELDEISSPHSPSYVDVKMTSDDLYRSIIAHFQTYPQCRVSWLNRLLAKCHSGKELNKAINLFHLYQSKLIETTPETGTLLIKAACRAGLPERALGMLLDIQHTRIWPTLGGIHYLMINFSLRKDTNSVLEAFKATELRRLKPTTRTYHILIRECVDNNMVDKALKFAIGAKKNNVIPNRVTYNILMNGLRKEGRAVDILNLRREMNDYKIEINDTTVKFTAIAEMMLDKPEAAVKAFKEFPELDSKMEEFSSKFFEVFEEDNYPQKLHVISLFRALQKKMPLPESITKKVDEFDGQLAIEKLALDEKKAALDAEAPKA